jgi:integral membrane protein (TIGR01906 family)
LGFIRQVAALLFIIAVPVALFTSNIRILANEPHVYEYAADHYDTPSTTGIPRAELLKASAAIREYFRNDEDTLYIRVINSDGETVPLFNSRETQHMRDVKSVLRMTFRVQEAAVLFVLAYVVAVFIWARETSLRSLATQLIIAGGLGLVAIGAVGAFAAIGFDQFWNRFHGVIFSNDLWQLDPERDHLIQMFPDGFWRDASLWIGIGTLAELAVLAGAAALYLGLNRRSTVTYEAPLPHGARA